MNLPHRQVQGPSWRASATSSSVTTASAWRPRADWRNGNCRNTSRWWISAYAASTSPTRSWTATTPSSWWTPPRGEAPGTLYVIEDDGTGRDAGGVPAIDGHRMTPDTVLALLGTLCAGTGGQPPRRVLIVGCEPASVEEGIGLSPPVTDAVPQAVRLIEELLRGGTPSVAPSVAQASTAEAQT